MNDLEKFKDYKGRWRTKSLFYENYMNNGEALYSLSAYDKEVDGKKYPSLKRLYLELEDVTEYIFANTYLGGWEHWQRLCNSYISDIVPSWREELELQLRSKAILAMGKEAAKGNFNAAKWIADKGWEGNRGRPTKGEREKRLKQDTELNRSVQEDMERLGISVIK